MRDATRLKRWAPTLKTTKSIDTYKPCSQYDVNLLLIQLFSNPYQHWNWSRHDQKNEEKRHFHVHRCICNWKREKWQWITLLQTRSWMNYSQKYIYTLIGCLMGSGTPYEPVSPSVGRLLGWSVCLSVIISNFTPLPYRSTYLMNKEPHMLSFLVIMKCLC